jgi:hypothetical protein
MLHTYFFFRNPKARLRARRYVAYQMEYQASTIKSEESME